MDPYFCTHLGKFTDHNLRTAVASISDILTISSAQNQNICTCYRLTHVAQSIAGKLPDMQTTSVINVDCHRCYLENIILLPQCMLTRPHPQPPRPRNRGASDPSCREDHVGLRW